MNSEHKFSQTNITGHVADSTVQAVGGGNLSGWHHGFIGAYLESVSIMSQHRLSAVVSVCCVVSNTAGSTHVQLIARTGSLTSRSYHVHGGTDMLKMHGHGIAGQVVHVTQRCYNKQFFLQKEADRRRWLYWLYQARKRYGLRVLNYVVTSNHVHLLVLDPGSDLLDASMRLINTRTTKELNRYHKRRCPLWEADFQATAIQTNAHLARCMNYIDMNMVRAGEVKHPKQWRCSGYYESLHPSKRGGRLDHASIRKLLQFDSTKSLQLARDSWITSKLSNAALGRESYWSDSIAVGDLAFALKMKRAMAYTQPGRRAQREPGCFAVR